MAPMLPAPTDSDGDPVENSAAVSSILDTLPAMTSRRSYAVATLALSLAALSVGCSRAGTEAAPTQRSSTAPSPSASPTPPEVSLNVAQAKAVALLTQRATGRAYPGVPRLKALDWDVCGEKLTTPPGSTWLSGSSASPDGVTVTPAEAAKLTIGSAYSVVTLLDDESSRAAWDARLAKWTSSCPDAESPVAPLPAEQLGTDSAFAYTRTADSKSPLDKHVSAVVARTGNTGFICWLTAKDQAAATSAATSCARDVVLGARLLTDLAEATGPLGAKALLANVVTRPEAKSEVTFDPELKVGPPCGSSPERVMTGQSASATFRPVGTDMYEPATATAGVLAMPDATAARTRVAQAVATLGRCSGTFQRKLGSRTFPGRVTGVEKSSLGGGGIVIRDEVRYGGTKPQKGYTAVFSVGRFVVQVDGERAGHGERIATAIASAVQ